MSLVLRAQPTVSTNPQQNSMQNYPHKVIPENIRAQAIKALSFYPELKEVPITFKFKDNIKKSTMQAQPKFSGILRRRNNRGYYILISRTFKIEDKSFNTLDVPDNILVGWFGHELGHVVDYNNRTALGMIIFGIRYLYSQKYIQKVERAADVHAVEHGMANYIIATKNFILNYSGISETYKARIKRLYLSPEEIMQLVNELDKDELRKEVDEKLKEQ